MILVDTCVWIDQLRGRQTAATRFLDQIEAGAQPEICISGVIYFEVLRGIRDSHVRESVSRALRKLDRRDYFPDSIEQMLRHDLECRRRGILMPKLGDWLILQTALDHDLELLTSDADFRRVLPVVPLRLVEGAA